LKGTVNAIYKRVKTKLTESIKFIEAINFEKFKDLLKIREATMFKTKDRSKY
jgi:hypothetical protein